MSMNFEKKRISYNETLYCNVSVTENKRYLRCPRKLSLISAFSPTTVQPPFCARVKFPPSVLQFRRFPDDFIEFSTPFPIQSKSGDNGHRKTFRTILYVSQRQTRISGGQALWKREGTFRCSLSMLARETFKDCSLRCNENCSRHSTHTGRSFQRVTRSPCDWICNTTCSNVMVSRIYAGCLIHYMDQ